LCAALTNEQQRDVSARLPSYQMLEGVDACFQSTETLLLQPMLLLLLLPSMLSALASLS
jgi:hypothetical protein